MVGGVGREHGGAKEAAPDFTWRDAGRTVLFGGGAAGRLLALLAENGIESFELVSTERALAGAPGLADAANSVHLIAAGGVPEAAAAILEDAEDADHLVALGGGRVIDAAKAVAAVSGAEVAAIPTTMSGAEMTGFHRLPAGAESRARGLVRPALVIADPGAMTTQPEARLRASSINALAHGAESLYTPLANPVSRMTALRGAALIASALDQGRDGRDRAALALGSILCGYAIDSSLLGIHHVICQSLVRVCDSTHAETNAAVLPRVIAAMRGRVPAEISALASSLGTDPGGIEQRILDLGGNPPGLAAAGADRSKLEQALDAIEARPEMKSTPQPPSRDELRELIEAAW